MLKLEVFNGVVIESHSEVVIGLLNKGRQVLHSCRSLVREFFSLIGHGCNFHWRDILREVNSATMRLQRMTSI